MGKQSFKNVIGNIQTSLVRHSPEILTGIGIAGMVTTTILAVKATPKALRLIEAEKQRQNETSDVKIEKLKASDTFKVTWKCYIPSAVIGTVSIACLIGASSVHVRRNAILATAYKLSESALTEYKEKVVETIGEKKEEVIREKIAKDRIENKPINSSEVIITDKGNTMCYDYFTDRYFKSDIDKIKKAVNELNSRMLRESYISLNDFYDEVGIPGTKVGNKMGWNTDKGLISVHYSSHLHPDGTPCLAIEFNIDPQYDFDRYF